MKVTHRQMQNQSDLVAIATAKSALAAIAYGDAQGALDQTEKALEQARDVARDALESWRDSLSSRLLGPETSQLLASSVIEAERQAGIMDQRLDEALRFVEQARDELGFAEARVEAERTRKKQALKRYVRAIDERRAEAARQQHVAREGGE